jgi:hypothetical protein
MGESVNQYRYGSKQEIIPSACILVVSCFFRVVANASEETVMSVLSIVFVYK